MARSTVWRIFLLAIASYLALVALFLALPSFSSVHSGNFSHYHQDVLRAGRTLTSVYDNKDIYRTDLDTDYDRSACFFIEWQLVKDEVNQALLLGVGHGISKKINLTKLAGTNPSATTLTASDVISISGRRSEYVGGISPPWFNPADTCLIEWESSQETKSVHVRAIVPAPGVVQIWPDNKLWSTEPWDASWFPTPDDDLKPFMTISNIPLTGNKANIAQIQIDDMTWQVPTRTFGLRFAIFTFLKPITLVAMEIGQYWLLPLMMLLTAGCWFTVKVGIVLMLVVFISWLLAGRPPFTEWFLSRRVVKHVLQKGRGRAQNHSQEREATVEKDGDMQRRTDAHEDLDHPVYGTLETPLDFFSSKSPLDDLLNTFEITRWMTRPLRSNQAQLTESIAQEPGYNNAEAC